MTGGGVAKIGAYPIRMTVGVGGAGSRPWNKRIRRRVFFVLIHWIGGGGWAVFLRLWLGVRSRLGGCFTGHGGDNGGTLGVGVLDLVLKPVLEPDKF